MNTKFLSAALLLGLLTFGAQSVMAGPATPPAEGAAATPEAAAPAAEEKKADEAPAEKKADEKTAAAPEADKAAAAAPEKGAGAAPEKTATPEQPTKEVAAPTIAEVCNESNKASYNKKACLAVDKLKGLVGSVFNNSAFSDSSNPDCKALAATKFDTPIDQVGRCMAFLKKSGELDKKTWGIPKHKVLRAGLYGSAKAFPAEICANPTLKAFAMALYCPNNASEIPNCLAQGDADSPKSCPAL